MPRRNRQRPAPAGHALNFILGGSKGGSALSAAIEPDSPEVSVDDVVMWCSPPADLSAVYRILRQPSQCVPGSGPGSRFTSLTITVQLPCLLPAGKRVAAVSYNTRLSGYHHGWLNYMAALLRGQTLLRPFRCSQFSPTRSGHKLTNLGEFFCFKMAGTTCLILSLSRVEPVK